MRWADGGLRQRLVLITLVAGLVTAAAGVALIRGIERDNLLRDASERNFAAAERAALRIDDRIAAFRTMVEISAASRQLFDPELSPSSTAAILLRVLPEADEVVIYDDTGEPIAAAASTTLLQPDELPPRTPLTAGSERTTVSWADAPFRHIEVTVTIEDPPGTPIGLLSVRAPVSLLAEDALPRSRFVDGATMLTTGDGTLVVHTDSSRMLDDERFDLEQLVNNGSYEAGEGDERTLVSGVPLASLPGWALSERSRLEVLGPANITFGRLTWVFLAVITAMVITLLFGVRQILGPLQVLTAAVDRVRYGDRSTRIAPGGTGEIGLLEDAFNRMIEEIDDRERDLRRSEQDARSAVERLQMLIDGATDSAIFFVDLHGNVRSWNTGARRLLAYREQEILDRPLTHLFEGDDVDDPLSLVSGHNRVHLEGWCVRREGSRFRARLSLSALQEPSGEQQLSPDRIGYAAIVNDLTDREIAQGSLHQALERELAAAADLRKAAEIKNEFLAIAAHELRTPLSAVLGSIGVLGDGRPISPDERDELYEIIATAADDLHDIIEQLLDFSRVQAGDVRTVEVTFALREAIESHLEPLQRELREHVVTVDAADVAVTTDPDVLRHIVTNLASNAAKFSPPGTTVGIGAAIDGDILTVTVDDEGLGIPEQEQDRIFELFRRSTQRDTTASGAGVGLAIVKRCVELVGGEIHLRSSPEAGSTFTVQIPTTQGGARNGGAGGAAPARDVSNETTTLAR